MKTQVGLWDSRISSPFCKRAMIPTLLFWVLVVGNLAFAQQDSGSVATINQTGSDPWAFPRIVGGSAVGSSSQPTREQNALPDAPSASRRTSLNSRSLTFGDRLMIYTHTIVSPYSIVGPALGAGIGQWENEPPGWGQGGEGYAGRLASGMGRQLISETIRFGFAAADGEDPRYQRSDETGIWNRARHAIVETFTSQTSSGTRIPAYSRFAGTYGAAFISNSWYPENRSTTGYALRRGSTALASSLGFHLFEEFVPRKYFNAVNGKD